jgi:hypothetical protein
MKKQKKFHQSIKPASKSPAGKTLRAQPAAKPRKAMNWWIFSAKIVLLFAVAAAVVRFTDKKEYFVGDQTNNHVERKWRSFYRFTGRQHKDVDIVVFGNSHASAGIDPFLVSMATGVNCFILNTPGSSIVDAYFNLKEVLKYTKPKLAILETFFIFSTEIGEEWGRIQSFEAKKKDDVWGKLKVMPYLFLSDEYVKAWSPTIRNHSFLLTDMERIRFNREHVGLNKNPDRVKLDLGRFSHGNNFLKENTLHLYDSLGAPAISSRAKIAEGTQKYLKKFAELCKENDIEMMFFTVPMYPKVFSCYDSLRMVLQKEFDKYPHAKWCNLQYPYDSILLTKEAYNDEYSGSQHTTSYGMIIATQKLTDFIVKNYEGILPDRSKDKDWIADFCEKDEFAYYQPIVPKMKDYISVEKDKNVGKFHIREVVLRKNEETYQVIVKIDDDEELTDRITMLFRVELNGEHFTTPLDLSTDRTVSPPKHKVYFTSVRKDVNVLGVAQ